jgi:hypothetical protein
VEPLIYSAERPTTHPRRLAPPIHAGATLEC